MIQGLKKKKRKNVLPNVEGRNLTVRPPHTNSNRLIGYLALKVYIALT